MQPLRLRIKRWHIAVAVGVMVAVAGTAYAVTSTTVTSNGIDRIVIKTSTAPSSTSSGVYVNMSGGSVDITLDNPSYIRARFSAESTCHSGETNTPATCSIRLAVTPGSIFLDPNSGMDFAFDSDNGTSDPDETEAASMERVSGLLQPGTYTVKVQFAAQPAPTTFTLDDWTLSVEALR